MKDVEIQDRLRMAIQTLARGDIPGGLAHLHGLSDALKANPPLAVVEGYVDKVELPYLVQEDGGSWTLPTIMQDNKGWETGAVAVTVTIRKRELGAIG